MIDGLLSQQLQNWWRRVRNTSMTPRTHEDKRALGWNIASTNCGNNTGPWRGSVLSWRYRLRIHCPVLAVHVPVRPSWQTFLRHALNNKPLFFRTVASITLVQFKCVMAERRRNAIESFSPVWQPELYTGFGVADSLDADSCIMAVGRMIARLGKPSHLWSDCGKNFFSANKIISQAVKRWNTLQIEDNPAKKEFSGILTLSDAPRWWSPGTPRPIGIKALNVVAAKQLSSRRNPSDFSGRGWVAVK